MAGTATEGLALPRLTPQARVLIVVAPYYRAIADGLVAGARAVLEEANAAAEIVEVPGALEIPPTIRLAAESGRYEGYVALGCVIRGETTHYDTVCNDSSRGLMLLGVERGLCIGNGILTCENMVQAEVRADPGDMNKGGGAAAAAVHLIALARRFRAGPSGPEADVMTAAVSAQSRTA